MFLVKKMKNKVKQIIDNYRQEIIDLGDTLFKTPELGYKEFKTKEILVNYFKLHGLKVESEYCITGFKITIGEGKPHIGLIAELDAIPTANHPYANLDDLNAAHSCGHSTQCAIMAATLVALNEIDELKNKGRVTLYFTPAEEYTDLAYRETLINEGKIKNPGGKVNMLLEDVFGDVDLCIHLHAMSEGKYQYGVNSRLAGFIYKKFIFKGKASHAAVLPHEGINALNAFSLFLQASAMLRETFKDDDMNRFHGRLVEAGDTVNSVPEKAIYESYVRSFNPNTLKELSAKLTNAAIHSAKAIGADCEVLDRPGYLPFNPSRPLSEVVYKNMLEYVDDEVIIKDEKSIAAGDVGDLACFKPTIQFGYGGIKGVVHGKNMEIGDKELVYITTAKIVAASVIDLLNDYSLVEGILKDFETTMTFDEYLAYLNSGDC